MATRKTYTLYKDGKRFQGFWRMQKGFAKGVMAAISALYNLPEKYTLKCDQTDEVVDAWGPNKVVVNVPVGKQNG
jgi:hypothetical protein